MKILLSKGFHLIKLDRIPGEVSSNLTQKGEKKVKAQYTLTHLKEIILSRKAKGVRKEAQAKATQESPKKLVSLKMNLYLHVYKQDTTREQMYFQKPLKGGNALLWQLLLLSTLKKNPLITGKKGI